MKWERRHLPNEKIAQPEPTELPVDYIKLVTDTLTTAMDKGLGEVKKTRPKAAFYVNGAIYSDEVLLAVTLSQGDQDLAATTVYASTNFNPTSEKPNLEDSLSTCLDAVGALLEYYLNPHHPDRIEDFLHSSISALDEAPFEWTSMDFEGAMKWPVWAKIDKTNPQLEMLADNWLAENDPDHGKQPQTTKEAEAFLEERLEAMKAAKSGGPSGGSMGGSGPITH
jgi:hypothetical protein